MHIYKCPRCHAKGKQVQSSTIAVTFTASIDERGEIVLDKPDKRAFCFHCGADLGQVDGKSGLKLRRIKTV